VHSLQVTVAGSPAVDLHYRKGYLDPRSDRSKLSTSALSEFVWSPLEANGIGMGAHVQKTGAGIEVALRIDARSIAVQPNGDHWAGELDLLLAQIDDKGKQTATVADTLKLDLDQAAHEKVEREGLLYTRSIQRSTKAAALRVIVRDTATGAMGSLTAPMGCNCLKTLGGSMPH
jgi:hypothetical protein